MKMGSALLNLIIFAVAALVVFGFLTATADTSAQTGYPPPEPPAAATPLQGSRRIFLPLVSKYYPVQPKIWSGMHLGNRNSGDWNSAMLAPFDGSRAPSAAWPRIVIALSRHVFNFQRDGNCRITLAGVTIRNPILYDYLRRATQSGQTNVIIRIYPSPGNFAESVDPAWLNPQTRPPGRTLLTSVGQRPGNTPLCGNDNRFRPVDDIVDEMVAIQQFVGQHGWQVYGFEPANEPNIEWYAKPHPQGISPWPDFTQAQAWTDMDAYFASIWTYARARSPGNIQLRIFTPPMAQGANAEERSVRSNITPCERFEIFGYDLMNQVYDNQHPKSDGYAWHNYWVKDREAWADCPNGMHVSMWFTPLMTNKIVSNHGAFISEADLAPPQFGWNNFVTNKDTQAYTTAASIRLFLYHEYNANGTSRGADRIAVWLLNDDCNPANDPVCQKHQWSQAYNTNAGTNVFRHWFEQWWFLPETP